MPALEVPRMHVLLVDDDASLRRALARAIRLAGFEVDAFGSVELLASRRSLITASYSTSTCPDCADPSSGGH
jgi:ActR/RegA family two-component response regulator